MSDFKAYVLVTLAIIITMFTAMHFDKQGERLCVQEAMQAKYAAKDAAKLCGISHVSLEDKE